MHNRSAKTAFTLLELMIASAVAILVLLPCLSVFTATHRLVKTALTETECALEMRELRNRLLYRISPQVNSGLLAGIPAADAASFTIDLDAANPDRGKIRILQRTENGTTFLFNERQEHTQAAFKWLRPAGLAMGDPFIWSEIVNWGFNRSWETRTGGAALSVPASATFYAPPFLRLALRAGDSTRYQWLRVYHPTLNGE